MGPLLFCVYLYFVFDRLRIDFYASSEFEARMHAQSFIHAKSQNKLGPERTNFALPLFPFEQVRDVQSARILSIASSVPAVKAHLPSFCWRG